MATYTGTVRRESKQLSLWKNQPSTKTREVPIDKILLAIVLGLTVFGLLMVYSASAMLADKLHNDQFHFFVRQGMWAVVGLFGMAMTMKIDYRLYKKRAFILFALYMTIVLLCAVFFFPKVNNAHRWILFKGFSLQPSEVAKLALVAFLAYYLEKYANRVEDYKKVFIPTAVTTLLIVGLIGAQPDLGTALMIFITFAVVLYQACVPIRHLATLAIPVVPALVGMLVFVPWRLQRLLDFLNPWKNEQTSSYQVVQSLIAVGSGGINGLGYSQGKQKLFFLPSPHADFIFGVIGEELGLIGSIALVAAFGAFAWRGFKAARHAPDRFGNLLGTGLTVLITAQAFFNISVALSLVPTKGIPLPFISAGGSSLAITLAACGILLNISKHEGA
ncbi:MAG: putative lipid II flippase FtsW [Acidobacteriota bacterium]